MINKLKSKLDNGIAKEVIWSIAIKVVYTIVTPVTIILLARILGPEEFGVYAFTISVLTLLAVPTSLGFPTVIMRFASNYHYKEKWAELKGLFRFTNTVVFGLGIAIICLTVLILFSDIFSIDEKNRAALYYGIPIVLILGLEGLRSASLIGIDKVILGQIPTKIIRPIIFVLLIVIGYLTIPEISAIHGILLYLCAAIISYSSGAIILIKNLPKQFSEVVSRYEYRPWLKSAMPLLVLGSVQVLGGQIDILVLGIFRTNEEVGIYKVVYQTGLLVIFGLSAINSVITPKISNLFIDNKLNELKSLLVKSNWSIFLLGLPIALTCIFFGKFVLNIVFGSQYVIGFQALNIIVLGRLVNTLLGSSSLVLKMTGFEKIAAYGIMIGTLTNIILDLVLIPKFGIEGAAIASSVGMITWNIFLYYSIKFKLNINVIK